MTTTQQKGKASLCLLLIPYTCKLSLSSPVYQVEMLCDLYAGFEPSQLSCLGSLVGKSVVWRADGRGFNSHPRQQIFLRKITVSGELCCAHRDVHALPTLAYECMCTYVRSVSSHMTYCIHVYIPSASQELDLFTAYFPTMS